MLLNLESEKRINRLRSLLSSLLKSGFFHIFGSNTINQIVYFAHGILIVRVISKAEYGIYGYAYNIFSFFLLLSGFGIISAMMQLASEYADNPEKSSNLLQYGYRFGLGFNVILAALVLLTSLLFPLPIKGSNYLLGMMFLLPVPLIIKELQTIWLRVNLQNREYGAVNTINAILIGTMTILGAWAYQSKGIIISHYLVTLFMVALLWKHYHIPFIQQSGPLSREDKRDLLRIAGISTLNNALSQLLSLLGTFMLGLVVSDAGSIAAYKVASTIPLALNFIPVSLVIFVYPYFAKNKNKKSWVASKYQAIMLYAGLGNLVIALFGILFAEPVIRIIFGTQYLDSVQPFRILMAAFFVSGTFRTISGNLLVTQRKLTINLIIGIVGAITGIVCNVLFIPGSGSYGAALSYLVTMLVTGLISSVAFIITIKNIVQEKIGLEG